MLFARRGSRSSAGRRSDPIPERRGRGFAAAPPASPSPCRRRRSDGFASCHSTGASSMTRAGCGLVDTATVTPSGSVQHGPVVCPDGKPTTTGPGNPRVSRVESRRARVTCPPGSSHPRISPKTSARARASTTAQPSCVSMRSSRYGRSLTSSRNRTHPSGGSNANGVPSEATSCVIVPPNSGPRASPARSTVSPSGASSSPRPPRQEREKRPLVVPCRHRPDVLRASVRAAP